MTSTINELIAQVTDIKAANGGRDSKGDRLSPEHPFTKIEVLHLVQLSLAKAVKAIRTNGDLHAALDDLHHASANLGAWSLPATVEQRNPEAVAGRRLRGSTTETITQLMLVGTEVGEAIQAVKDRDVPNMTNKMADAVIRVLDVVSDWNDAYPEQPIDLGTAIVNRLREKRTRG